MSNISFIENQFEYMRRRGIKGEISLTSHLLTKDEAKILKNKGYKVIPRKEGLFKTYYEITQYAGTGL